MARQKHSGPPDPRWRSDLAPAPGDLRIVQAFVNTTDGRQDPEFVTAPELADWLTLWDLAPRGTELGIDDFARALEVRAALRTLVATPTGDDASEAAACLNRVGATLRLRFAADGRCRFEPVAGGLDGALAWLCVFVAEAQIKGTWPRLKICAACRKAFFDLSKNRSAKWCTARCGCGNQVNSWHDRHRHLEEARKSDTAAARTRAARARRDAP